MPAKGRQVVVVKSLRDLSPKKTILVSRDLQADDSMSEKLGKSSFGNHSPSVSVAVS
jgi:hypothetical protein